MKAHALPLSPASSSVRIARTAAGATVILRSKRALWITLWIALVLIGVPTAVILRLPFADALSTAAAVLAVMHFTRVRRVTFHVASDRVVARALTEHAFATTNVERFVTCTTCGFGELPCIGMQTSAGLVAFPMQQLAAEDADAAVTALNLELAHVRAKS